MTSAPGSTPTGLRDDELAGLTRSFNAMADELETARGHERAFLLSVSHDLRTPLTSIRGYAEAIADGTVAGADERIRAAHVIEAEARRLERLVADLLDLARLDTHEFSLTPRPIDARATSSRTTVAGFQPAARDYGVTLTVAPGATIPADADPERLAQIVANLVENALKYAASSVEVDVVRPDDGRSRSGSTTTAPASRPTSATRVFDRLYTARRWPAAPSAPGSASRSCASWPSAMGGSARCDAVDGGGARFVVTIPRLTPSRLLSVRQTEDGVAGTSAPATVTVDLGGGLDLAAHHRERDDPVLAGHRRRARDARRRPCRRSVDLGAVRRAPSAPDSARRRRNRFTWPRESMRQTSSWPMKQPFVNDTASTSRNASCGIVDSSTSTPWAGMPASMRSTSSSSCVPVGSPLCAIQATTSAALARARRPRRRSPHTVSNPVQARRVRETLARADHRGQAPCGGPVLDVGLHADLEAGRGPPRAAAASPGSVSSHHSSPPSPAAWRVHGTRRRACPAGAAAATPPSRRRRPASRSCDTIALQERRGVGSR